MIYTITFNPSIDYYTYVDTLSAGQIMRARSERLTYGGKGLNVSCVLTRLSVANRALGFLAGGSGALIDTLLTEDGVTGDFVRLTQGQSRICVKIRTDEETDIHGAGPTLTAADIDALRAKLAPLTAHDTLVIAGSLPPGLADDTYEQLLASLPVLPRIVADTTGARLRALLPFRPFLIKPNHHELGELVGAQIDTHALAADAARSLQEQGARNVLVSMGARGALLLTEDGTALACDSADITALDTVGAGDSMVAGFLAGWEQEKNMTHALRMGTAAASATCMVQGLARREDVLRLYQQITVDNAIGMQCVFQETPETRNSPKRIP